MSKTDAIRINYTYIMDLFKSYIVKKNNLKNTSLLHIKQTKIEKFCNNKIKIKEKESYNR